MTAAVLKFPKEMRGLPGQGLDQAAFSQGAKKLLSELGLGLISGKSSLTSL